MTSLNFPCVMLEKKDTIGTHVTINIVLYSLNLYLNYYTKKTVTR